MFEILSPCIRPITILQPSPFSAELVHYISDEAVVIEWDYSTLITQEAQPLALGAIDCSDKLQIEFFQ